ncbi:MAG: S9 family peptidase [Verrucomicrobia bacterium]|nr:S9 family peptidase [Verrucomicrobiota bacterium]
MYPEAKVEPVSEVLHGVEVTDNYRWLEDTESPEVQAWIEKQNKITRRQLDRFPQREAILARLKAMYDEPSLIHPDPCHKGNRYFFWQRQPGQNHSVLYMTRGHWDGNRTVLLDPNTWSKDGSVSCDYTHITDDGTLMAYGKVEGGNENATLYVLDLDTGEHLRDTIPFTRWCSVAWLPDKSGFYYTRYPDPRQGGVAEGDEFYYVKMYFHALGTDWHNDPLVWGEGKPKEYLCWAGVAPDRRHLFITGTTDWNKNDVHVVDLEDPAREIRPVVEGYDANFGFTAIDGMFYFETTLNAPRRAVYRCPADDPRPENWQLILAEPDGVLRDWTIINRQFVVHVMKDAYSRLFIYSLDGDLLKEIELPTLGSAGGLSGEWDGTELFFDFSSWAYPDTVFRHDMVTGELEVIDRLKIDADLTQYETRQVWTTSKDGTRVPMFIVAKKGLVLDGANPTELSGYGGFNVSMQPGFSRPRLIWLDAGGVFAIACLRGGGEYGREWHEAGRREHKQNVFDDFIAAAEYLIAEQYTNPDRLAITGGSNGGLLMGAAFTQRPDLFRAVICGVPLLDMLRYHKLTVGDIWSGEYGTADDPEQFRTLLAYSPYQHVRPGTAYPAILMKTSAQDTRVAPAHALKMTALLQASTASDPNERPILLHVQEKTGHGSGRPLEMSLGLMADDFTWLMWQLGMFDDGKRDICGCN